MSLVGVLALVSSTAVMGLASVPAQAAVSNVALNKSASGAAPCNANESWPKAVDGSVASTTNKWCSTATTKNLDVDLGSVQNIQQFVVKHAGAGGENTAWNTKNFNIQTKVNSGDSYVTAVTVSNNTLSTSTHNITATSARYIRLDVIDGTQGSGGAARIYELEAYASPNQAFNKSTSGAAGCNGSETVAQAVDESTSTKWCTTAATKNLDVDLGAVLDLRQFVVKHAGAGGENTAWNTKNFNIQTKVASGDPWVTAATGSNNTASTTTHDIAPTYARYVRLNVIDGVQSGTNVARIYELEVQANYPNRVTGGWAPWGDDGLECWFNGGPSSNIADKNLSTRWCSQVESTGDQWTVGVNLDTTRTLTGFRVYHAGSAGQNPFYNTGSFEISAPGEWEYQLLYSTSGNVDNISAGTLSGSASTVQLKINCAVSSYYCQGIGDERQVYEFEVYGY